MRKPKLATDLPPPPKLTPEDIERITKQAREWSNCVREATAEMERIPGWMYHIRVR